MQFRIPLLACLGLSAALLLGAVARAQPIEAPVLESVRLQSAVTIRATLGTTNWIMVADALNPSAWRVLTNVVVESSPYVFIDTEAASWQRYYQVMAGPEPPVITWDTNEWAYMPPGTFTMGSSEGESDRDGDEGPQTEVTLTSGFWMGRYEVTQRQYLAVMGTNPSYYTGDLDRPVERVTWDDAVNYCAALTAQERATGRLPDGWEYRLPTEAQWEYACRAGTTTQFSYGDDPAYAQLADYGWYDANSGSQTHPVGQKLPNPWGLYDMHGNVWEWCLDFYEDSLPGGSVADPVGPSSGSSRVYRGGCWEFPGQMCRSADRRRGAPSLTDRTLGFRVAAVQVR